MLAPSETTQILQYARNYIADPEHYIAGIRQAGVRVCALGALERAYGLDAESAVDHRRGIPDEMADDGNMAIRLLANASRELFPGSHLDPIGGLTAITERQSYRDIVRVARTNNELGHAATVKMFDRAAEMSRLLIPA